MNNIDFVERFIAGTKEKQLLQARYIIHVKGMIKMTKSYMIKEMIMTRHFQLPVVIQSYFPQKRNCSTNTTVVKVFLTR